MENGIELPNTEELEEAVRRDRYYHRFRNMVTSTFLTLVVGAAVLLIARRRAVALFLCLAMVFTLSAPTRALAEEVNEFPDLDRLGSVTATFTYYDKDSGDTLPVAGGNSVGLYKVADVKVDNGFIFVVDPRFASAGEIPATSEELDSVNIELAGKMAKNSGRLRF